MPTASNITRRKFLDRLGFLQLPLWPVLACSLAAAEEAVLTSPLRKALHVFVDGSGRLKAAVDFRNVGREDVFVLKRPPNIFVDYNGQEIPNIGPSEKRPAYTAEDYERLSPSQATHREKDITDVFEWLPGAHTYEASITGNYKDPFSGQSWTGPRVVTRFSWTK